MAIVPTDEQRRCANYSDDEWQVSIDRGHVTISKASQREPDTGPALPFVPPKGDALRGRRHTLAFAGGYLVGSDAGEWGGSLSWFASDGSQRQVLGDVNVHGLVALAPDLAMALEGLAHMSIDEGAVQWIERAGTKLDASKKTPLPGAPGAFVAADDGAYVLTTSDLVKVTKARDVRVVQPVRTGGLYPDSMAIDATGALWVGMRQFVLRLTPHQDRYTETWFVPEACQQMEIADLECHCRGR